MSLLEVMIGVMLSTLMVLPIVGWTSLAMRQQREVITRNLSGASLGNLRTIFTRDVAGSTEVWVDGEHLDDCMTGIDGARTVLMVAQGDRRTAYAVVPSSRVAAASTKDAALRAQPVTVAADESRAEMEQKKAAEAAQAASAKAAESDAKAAVAEQLAQSESMDARQAAMRERSAKNARAEADAAAAEATQAKEAEQAKAKEAEQAKLDEQAKADAQAKEAERAKADEQVSGADAGSDTLVRVRCAKPGVPSTVSSDLVDDVMVAGTDATCVSTAELAKRSGSKDESLFSDSSCRRVTLRITTAVLDQVALTAVRRSGGSVAELDVAPIATIAAKPTTGPRKLTVAFDASGSSDPLGEQLSYQWSFGDGSNDKGAAVTHAYTATGTFTATLTVSTPSGRTSSSTVPITVADNVPVAVIAAPVSGTSVNRGQKIAFSSAGSGDPLDAPYGGKVVGYAWDFGDGTTSTEANPTKAYTELSPVGGFVVSLAVSDDAGQISVAKANVVVANALPAITLTATPSSGVAPLSVTFSASVVDEPDLSPAPPLTWSWDLGNGTTLTSAAPVSTTYKTSGTFTAKVTVTDDSGATATATQTVTVGAVGPAAPANLRKSKSGKSGKLRYMDMAWDRRDGATNYEVRLSCVKCAEVISGQGTGTTLRITGLSATAQDYDAQIRAVNSTGTWGDWSAPVRVKS